MTVTEEQVELLAEAIHAHHSRGQEGARGREHQAISRNDKWCRDEARSILTLLATGGWRITR